MQKEQMMNDFMLINERELVTIKIVVISMIRLFCALRSGIQSKTIRGLHVSYENREMIVLYHSVN